MLKYFFLIVVGACIIPTGDPLKVIAGLLLAGLGAYGALRSRA